MHLPVAEHKLTLLLAGIFSHVEAECRTQPQPRASGVKKIKSRKDQDLDHFKTERVFLGYINFQGVILTSQWRIRFIQLEQAGLPVVKRLSPLDKQNRRTVLPLLKISVALGLMPLFIMKNLFILCTGPMKRQWPRQRARWQKPSGILILRSKAAQVPDGPHKIEAHLKSNQVYVESALLNQQIPQYKTSKLPRSSLPSRP